MMRALIALVAVLSWSISASADDDVMSVDAQPDGSDYVWMLTVTSRVNTLDAASIGVNRGNCRILPIGHPLPRVLRFGESVRYRAMFCHPIEVAVDVDGKSQLYTFGPQVRPGEDLHVAADVYNDSGYRNVLTVTNYSGDITLNQVTINRGNCGPFGNRKVDPPKRMHFGDYFEVRSFPCRPLEVTAQTDKGPITIKLN